MAGRSDAKWKVAPADPAADLEIARNTGRHPLVVRVLRNRGLRTPAEIEVFLNPSLDCLHDPGLLPDLAPAVERLSRAVDQGEQVLVHGDYDADGLTATALLARVLSKFGCPVHYHIPHRVTEQYGVSEQAVREAAEAGVTLLVTVDCGVSDHQALAEARAAGIEVVVIDHHEPGPTLPPGCLVIDPKRADSQYPERELAGVGLAYKVAGALCRHRGVSEVSLQRSFLDLVAVGTIADVVPLRGENRILAAHGLRMLAQTRSAGLRALLDLVGLPGPVGAGDVAFRIAPRLNAIGRIGDGADALDLLLAEDSAQARRLALHLDQANRERQREQEAVYRDALRMIDDQVDLDSARVLVLASPDWHVGVVGIVASKLLEEYHRPAIMLVEEEGRLRGSARSVEQFNMAAALEECSACLLRYGGHALAAGLTLHPRDLEEFRSRLNLIAARALPEPATVAQVTVDAVAQLDEVNEALLEQLAELEPFGHDNREPLFLSCAVEALECRTVGNGDRHLKLYLRQEGRAHEAIGFGLGTEASWIRAGTLLDVCHTPESNEFQGRRRLQLRLEALRPHRPGSPEAKPYAHPERQHQPS